MHLVERVSSGSQPVTVPDGLHYGVPCAFENCTGFFHPAAGGIGVVLCAPWGYEELTLRKSWRLLAETIAEAGFPCIRFDYPGTGNALRRATDVASMTEWVDAIGDAADMLRRHSGATRLVFVGQSLGAALAVEAARERDDVVGLQLIAPITKGRAYARELAATATIVAEKVGIAPDLAPDEGLSVLGFSFSPAALDSLKAIDLGGIATLAVAEAVVYDQADRKAGAGTAAALRKLGVGVTMDVLAPYHIMVSDATEVQPLPVDTARIVEHLRSLDPSGAAIPVSTPVPMKAASIPAMLPATLAADGFREEPLRFGAENALFGILCRPYHQKPGAPAVILLNRGLNPHTGWRRVSVDQARDLAAAGITSLRFDLAGLGESRDEPGRPSNLIYSNLLLPDIAAAVDVLVARGHGRIMLAGVCSGGFMALAAAHADPRVTDVVAVNVQRIVWNPAESVEEVIRYGLRSMNDYVGDMRGRGALKKLIRSRRRIVPAARFLVARGVKTAMSNIPIALRSAMLRGSMAARVNGFFSVLAERGTRVSLLYSEGDPGLVELRAYFGPRGRDLRFSNVSVSFVADADHNLTAKRASAAMFDHMLAFASAAPNREAARTARIRQASKQAVCPS